MPAGVSAGVPAAAPIALDKIRKELDELLLENEFRNAFIKPLMEAIKPHTHLPNARAARHLIKVIEDAGLVHIAKSDEIRVCGIGVEKTGDQFVRMNGTNDRLVGNDGDYKRWNTVDEIHYAFFSDNQSYIAKDGGTDPHRTIKFWDLTTKYSHNRHVKCLKFCIHLPTFSVNQDPLMVINGAAAAKIGEDIDWAARLFAIRTFQRSNNKIDHNHHLAPDQELNLGWGTLITNQRRGTSIVSEPQL